MRIRALSEDSDSSDSEYDDDFRYVSAIEMQNECVNFKRTSVSDLISKACYSVLSVIIEVLTVTSKITSIGKSSLKKESNLEEVETKVVNSLNNKDNEKWSGTVRINSQNLKLKLDTGANCNVLSEKEVKRLGEKINESKTKRLITYSGESIDVIGQVTLICETKKMKRKVNFQVVKQELQPILGRKMCEKLGFIIRVCEVDMETDKTSDKSNNEFKIGCCKAFEYDIDFIDNPRFKIIPARRIPHTLRNKAKKELHCMEKMKVIVKVSEPTPAVSPMLVVEQKDKVRVCMDPTDLNKNIKRRHFPLKTIEEIAAIIAGSKCFTKLDCQKGFWQLKVSERTSKYLTFSTPWGRYRYLRLPFGICSAPEVFCEVMNRTLEGIENCEVAMDDIFIHAPNSEQLKYTENLVIERLTKAGFTLNKQKCEFNKTSMKFLGHIFTVDGYKADDEKIKGIRQLKVPTSVKELQRLLGMVNYLGKFIKKLSELTDPLRNLLHADYVWQWCSEHQQAFENIKETLTTTPVLAYYDVNKSVKLSVDASSKSMGICLMQNDQPVAYATRAFNKSQQNQP